MHHKNNKVTLAKRAQTAKRRSVSDDGILLVCFAYFYIDIIVVLYSALQNVNKSL